MAVAVASDGTIYVGQDKRGDAGGCVRMICEGMVSTLHRCDSEVNGLCLDEPSGILYVSINCGLLTITVPTPAERKEARYYPALRTWALMQEEEPRAQMTPATGVESAEETRARETLRLLMRCPIAEILVRSLGFAYG